jgi:hypothetical protein
VLYLATSPNPRVQWYLNRYDIGLMCQPDSNRPVTGWIWMADNGCFNAKWDAEKWEAWLTSGMPRAGCLAAVVPDVVADAKATRDRWDRYAPIVRRAGFPAAYVLQDGATDDLIPWGEMDCCFVGGSTEFKLAESTFRIAHEARERGLWVHYGRVNSYERFKLVAERGAAHSADGSYLSYGPDTNLPKLIRWVRKHHHEREQTSLFNA